MVKIAIYTNKACLLLAALQLGVRPPVRAPAGCWPTSPPARHTGRGALCARGAPGAQALLLGKRRSPDPRCPPCRVMVLEATFIVTDNSDFMRNGDFAPSRLEARAP